MLNKFINNFKNLSNTDKSIIYLMWTYYIGTSLGGIFINVFIYNYFGSINGLIIFNLITYIFAFIGFSTIGINFSKYKINFKWCFGIGIFFYIASILTLLIFGGGNNYVLYAFSGLNGVGIGTFWCGVHTYELGYIEKKKRDFYSSVLSMGKELMTIVLPLLVSLIFLFANWKKNNGYNILFIIIILIFLGCYFFLRHLPLYNSKKISLKQVLREFNMKEIYQNLFFASECIATELRGVMMIIITIFLLKTEINIGIFQGIFGLIGIFVTIFLSTKRNERNRLKIMLIFSILFFFNLTFLGFNLTILGLIISKLIIIIITPGFDISVKVFLMKYMGDLRKEHDMFLSKVIYRELIIAISRIFMYGGLLLIINFSNLSELQIVKISLFIAGVMYIVSCMFVYLEEKRLDDDKV